MKDEQIEHIIDSMNQGSLVGRAFHHHLMANVHCARVWIEFPNESLPDKDGYDFYFIKHPESNLFVGAVLDMRYDLHAFVKSAYREQQLMSSALRNVILPHLFSQRERSRQYVQYRDARAKRLVEKVGFTIVDEDRAFIDKHQLPNVDFPSQKPTGLSKERIDAIQNRLLLTAGLVRMVRD